MENTEKENMKNGKSNFEMIIERWNKRQSNEKTPEYFISCFSIENSVFKDSDEMQKAIPKLEQLIDKQPWTNEQKQKTKDEINFSVFPEFRKDFAPYCRESFFSEIREWDPTKDYTPRNMSKVAFQQQTFNIIAARPSRGKTSFCVSLLIDYLEQKTDSSAVFLTLEETKKEIYTKIFNNLIFAEYKNCNQINKLSKGNPRVQLWNSIKTCADATATDSEMLFRSIFQTVSNRVGQLEDSGRLKVIDVSGKNINAIERLLTYNQNALVIIDYAQLIQCDPTRRGYTSLENTNDVINRLADCAKENKQIILAAVQMRRADGGADSDKPCELNDTQMKDSSQYEQAANTIIALGRNTAAATDKEQPIYFWKIVKNRNGGGVNSSFEFDTENHSIGFSFLRSTDKSAAYLDFVKEQSKKENSKKSTELSTELSTNSQSQMLYNRRGIVVNDDSDGF